MEDQELYQNKELQIEFLRHKDTATYEAHSLLKAAQQEFHEAKERLVKAKDQMTAVINLTYDDWVKKREA